MFNQRLHNFVTSRHGDSDVQRGDFGFSYMVGTEILLKQTEYGLHVGGSLDCIEQRGHALFLRFTSVLRCVALCECGVERAWCDLRGFGSSVDKQFAGQCGSRKSCEIQRRHALRIPYD